MHLLRLCINTVVLMVSLTFSLPNPIPHTNVSLVEGEKPYNPGSLLPPPNTPCKPECDCTEGWQPPQGRIYCGFCYGIEIHNTHPFNGYETVHCKPYGQPCCNYGYYDGRCHIPLGQSPNYKLYCPDGM